MSVATRGLATAVGLASILVVYRLLGVDQMAHVFNKKELRDKYDYIIGKIPSNQGSLHTMVTP